MTLEHSPAKGKRFRRNEASKYFKDVWGIDLAPKTLAKLACIGGGPEMEYFGRIPTYTDASCDAYAKSRLSPPVANTSQRQQQRRAA